MPFHISSHWPAADFKIYINDRKIIALSYNASDRSMHFDLNTLHCRRVACWAAFRSQIHLKNALTGSWLSKPIQKALDSLDKLRVLSSIIVTAPLPALVDAQM